MLPEVGATELLVIAAIALIVVGPKDLPILMRKVGRFVAHMRSMAMEFRASFDELARQSELEELRKEVEAMRQAAGAPVHAAGEAIGFHEMQAEIEGAITDPHALPEPPSAAPSEAAAPDAPEPAPKPKPKRRRKPKSADDSPAAETQP